MITVLAWAGHLIIYPAFTVYVWVLLPGARAFERYLDTMIEYMESLRDAELAQVEHARV